MSEELMTGAAAMAWAAVENFRAAYSHLFPQKGPDALVTELLAPEYADTSCTGEELLEALRAPRDWTPLRLLQAGIALVSKALQACDGGRELEAWPLAAEGACISKYLIGVIEGAERPPGPMTSDTVIRAMGSKGGKARAGKTDAMKSEIRAWCELHLNEFDSLNKLRDAVVETRVNAAAPLTIRYWLTEWAKEWRAAGRWQH